MVERHTTLRLKEARRRLDILAKRQEELYSDYAQLEREYKELEELHEQEQTLERENELETRIDPVFAELFALMNAIKPHWEWRR